MKVLMGVVFLLWGLFWSTGLFVNASAMEKLGGLIVGWAPLAAMAWFFIHRAKTRDGLRGELLAAMSVTRGSGWEHAEDGTAIAINPKQREIGMLVGRAYQVYSYDKVRGWEARSQQAGVVVPAFGVANGVVAIGAGERMAREARANTGFFVEVQDVNAPMWRIAMKDEATRARWMELLRQEINEGGAQSVR